ncbi:MAG TPA: phosphoglycerate kinase [Patescibacteria group bacterium]|nr:phosphoglycerate kinase [Patescibacteria group bacterium]
MVKSIASLGSLNGKTVLLRVDSDVDIENGKIVDDTRLLASLDTLHHLLKKRADVNIIGHLGRPDPKDPESNSKNFTLEPVAQWFADKLKGKVKPITIGRLKAFEITNHINLIENLRFFPEEEKNDPEFARELALLGDIYVDDAFAVSHRAHASIVGVTKYLPSYAGLHMQNEIEELSKILVNPKRPLAILIGGAKIETKLPMVEKMHHVADYVLVGGEIAEQDKVIIKVQHEKIVGQKSAVVVSESTEDGKDIDQKSVENFCQILGLANTIVWNGPVGFTDHGEKTERGTKALAEFIVSTNAYKVVGGGDTLAYLSRLNLLDKFDFVSTGGGAMLEFLSGKELPGIKALEK